MSRGEGGGEGGESTNVPQRMFRKYYYLKQPNDACTHVSKEKELHLGRTMYLPLVSVGEFSPAPGSHREQNNHHTVFQYPSYLI